jgi:hypothetical protein
VGLRRRTTTLALIALAAPAAALAVPADSALASPCQQAACRVQFMLGSTLRNFRSEESFDTTEAYVAVRLLDDGRALREASSSGADGCRRSMRGYGIAATVSTCAETGPVRVTAVRLDGAPDYLTISYRSWPYLNTGSQSSSSSGGAAAH